ncbi:TIGR03862 family flavoprotein [Hydrogenophaga sp.]|uniref:TIGR03862 family flavoprotein n=1 Tax=Hydrogenophaga sp. TaxID=1904254 RepID=UPI0025C7165D|nr:TIGR03862 family flavoprotein [Hydrogenophaga sp.]
MSALNSDLQVDVAVIGGGPAGLMAAEVVSRAGHAVHVFDAMPSVGRKFLLAGKGGMNLTHAEPMAPFVQRYAERAELVGPLLQRFGPQAVRDWAAGLGIDTFVGTSSRVFPTDMKAAPLLRAWLHRLRHPDAGGAPVNFHMRHRWQGWVNPAESSEGDALRFNTPHGVLTMRARATVLALGGASWARLGSDGAWAPWLQGAGVAVAPLQPSNCGFDVAASGVHAEEEGWSAFFQERFAGQPLKSVVLDFTDSLGRHFKRRGEFVVTAGGVEGSLMYAASALIRDQIARSGRAIIHLDLLPDQSAEQVAAHTAHPRGSRSLSAHLKSRLGLGGIKMALLNELLDKATLHDPQALAKLLKALPLTLLRPRPIDEAISTAGGVAFDSLDEQLMVRERPGLFCAGEMLDWEAPTGGYLLTACLSSGVAAGEGVVRWLATTRSDAAGLPMT